MANQIGFIPKTQFSWQISLNSSQKLSFQGKTDWIHPKNSVFKANQFEFIPKTQFSRQSSLNSSQKLNFQSSERFKLPN